MSAVADAIGTHQLPVNHDAKDIHEFLPCDAVHNDLIRQTLRGIYKANSCSHLDASIQQDATLIALGSVRGELLRAQSTDVNQLEFFDKFSAQMVILFDKYPMQIKATSNNPNTVDRATVLTPSTRYWNADGRIASAKD